MTRILVVEDEPGIALGLEDDLRMEGYEVEVAGDGLTALRRAREVPFDVIILDVMLRARTATTCAASSAAAEAARRSSC